MEATTSVIDGAFWLTVAAILALLVLSAFFSGSETALTAASRGKLRGLGLSTYVEVAGGVPSRISAQLGSRGARFEAVEVRVSAKGHVTILCGTHSHGQSHETTFPQLVCDKLGIAYDKVAFVQGDTDRVHYGRGTAASRSLAIGGAAIVKALDKIIDKGKSILAYSLDVDRRDIDFDDGAFSVAGTNQVIPFDDLCRMAYLAADFPPDEIEPGLAATAYYDPENWTYPGGCHICELEVDPEVVLAGPAHQRRDGLNHSAGHQLVEALLNAFGVVHDSP